MIFLSQYYLTSIFSIQRLRDVNSHNESIARFTLQEQKHLKRKHDQELTDEKLRASTAISQVRKQAAATTTKYESALKQQNELVQGYCQLSEEVADEFVSLSKTYDDKVPALKATAQKRLDRNKNLKEKISALKDELEVTHEDMQSQLDQARQDICVLQEQLHQKIEECEEFELMTQLAGEDLMQLRCHKLKKIGNPKSWDPIVTQLVIEMLAHQTPPSCVSANILSVVKLLMPEAPIIEELPSIRFIRNCRTVSLHLSKTLAAYEIAKQDIFLQLFTDGTTRRQTEFQNLVIGILTSSGYRRVALDSCIISEEHNAESVTASILVAFQRSGKLLDQWRAVTQEMYPNQPDLLDGIPTSKDLSLTKLAKGFTMTDTCNTARKIQQLLKDEISNVCKEKGLADEEIEVHTSYC